MAFYDTVRLEKGMYNTPGKSFTQVLEELDPSASYENTEFAGLDAYQRQLKRFDIKVGGRGSDVVEKFFQSTDSAALFPEYVARAVTQGMESANILPNLVATVTKIDGMDYRTITSEPEGEHYFPPVAELASLPQTTVKIQNNLVKMNKRGRMLVTSYEALRFQKLDLFTVVLRQIGAYIARAQAQDAVGVLLNGDGNNNPAEEMNGGSPAALSYDSLVKMWAGLAPFELNTMLAGTETVKSVLNLTEMKDAQAGLNFQGTGQMVTPIGAALIHVPTMADKVIVAMDKTCALEMVQAGELMTDYDKLIDRQLERASISAVTGFAKIFSDASKKLTIS